MILAGVIDLMFRSRIEEVARRVGRTVEVVRDPNALVERARSGPDLVLIDLDDAALRPIETIAAIRRECPDIRIVGFLSHVHRGLQQEAMAAGCTEAIARGEFTKRLPEILT